MKWALAFAALFLITIPLHGALLAVEWNWFVVPIFREREIGIAQGVGLGMFFAGAGFGVRAVNQWQPAKDKPFAPEDLFAYGIGGGVIGPGCALILAWSWHAVFL